MLLTDGTVQPFTISLCLPYAYVCVCVCVCVCSSGIYTNTEAIWLEKLGFGNYVSQMESKCDDACLHAFCLCAKSFCEVVMVIGHFVDMY